MQNTAANHRRRSYWQPPVSNGQGRARTADTRIFSPLLYQLSYLTEWADATPSAEAQRMYGPVASLSIRLARIRKPIKRYNFLQHRNLNRISLVDTPNRDGYDRNEKAGWKPVGWFGVVLQPATGIREGLAARGG